MEDANAKFLRRIYAAAIAAATPALCVPPSLPKPDTGRNIVIGADTLVRAKTLGLDGAQFLAAHDSYSFFTALGDLVITGPTLTNVYDIPAILIA